MIRLDVSRKLHGADGILDLKFKTVINKGELVTIYGPSGAGKSSILRMVAGLMNPHDGVISADDQVWYDREKRINVKPRHRNVGMVFQNYSLFPNMTVRENLRYALSENQPESIVDELIQVTELHNLQHKKPSILSGGQKQRAALVRALVRKPKILLLDEPLSALDTDMRIRLQDYILQFHHQFNLTTILVSHDLPEILKLSKRVLVLEKGSIKTDCPPQELLSPTPNS